MFQPITVTIKNMAVFLNQNSKFVQRGKSVLLPGGIDRSIINCFLTADALPPIKDKPVMGITSG